MRITALTVGALLAGMISPEAQTTGPEETGKDRGAGASPATATAAPPSAAGDGTGAIQAWTGDYSAAHRKAVDEKKDLLLVFTGSDWINLCELYDRDILFQPDFTGPILERFVPVRLDFPKDAKMSQQVRARNQMLMRAYRVIAFPTLILTDSEGRPYAINGYQPVTPADYAKVIEAMRQTRVVRDDLFQKAAEAEGVEKAALLAKAIPKLPGSLAGRYYRAELEEIMALDPDNKTGKTQICKKLIADVDYSDRMEKMKRDVEWSKMIVLTDAYIRDQNLQGSELQQAMFNKVGVYRDQANITEMARTLLAIIKIDETTEQAKKAQKVLDGMRAGVLQERLAPK